MLRKSQQRPSRNQCCDEADSKKATAIREKQATAFFAEEKEMQGGSSMMQIKTALLRRSQESATVEDPTLQIQNLSGVIAALKQTWRREAGNGILR